MLMSDYETLIPVNLITGFLGVGKTTAVLDLLARKAAGSRWAVLVNEYGEVGIDGALIAGDAPDGVTVREVGGGERRRRVRRSSRRRLTGPAGLGPFIHLAGGACVTCVAPPPVIVLTRSR